MGSIACEPLHSSYEIPDGVAQQLQRLFAQKNLSANLVMPGVAECVAKAKDVNDLHMVRHVMRNYQSSNFGPTRKRALALGNSSEFVSSSRDQLGSIPKNVEKLLGAKERELQAGPQIATAAVEAKETGLVDEEVEEAAGEGSSESTRQSSLNASISANNSTAVHGIVSLKEHFVQLFKRQKLSCKNVTEEVASRITDAKHVGELSLIWNVMRDFKSNNVGPTRKRVLALGNAAEVTTDLSQLTETMKRNAEGIPKKLRCMLEAKEAQLESGIESSSLQTPPAPPPKRQRSAATPSRAAKEELKRESSQPLPEQGGVVNADLLGRLAEAFGVDPDTVHRIRRRDALFSLIDIAMMVTGNDRDYAGQQIRFVQNKYHEVRDKLSNLKFPGRGQRETPVGDIYVVAEFVMLLPGKRAALVRSEAARLFVQFHGGDLRLVDGIIENRQRQAFLFVLIRLSRNPCARLLSLSLSFCVSRFSPPLGRHGGGEPVGARSRFRTASGGGNGLHRRAENLTRQARRRAARRQRTRPREAVGELRPDEV